MRIRNFGVIYCLTCNVNGKRFVGQTRRPLVKHFAGHNRRQESKILISVAIRYYGWEKFSAEILEEILIKQKLPYIII